MKTCKIDIKKRNDVAKNVGVGLLLASLLSAIVENKINVWLFIGMFMVSVVFIYIGICRDDD